MAYPIASPYVMAYQKLQSVINRKISETNRPEDWRFWNNRLHNGATEIAETYGVSIFQIVDEWEIWGDAVEAEREIIRNGGRA